MIDFENASFIRLSKTDINRSFHADLIDEMLLDDEEVFEIYTGLRDGIIFTNKRLITINVQGFTGKKKNYTFIPYNKIQVYSIETAGTFDLDCELSILVSGIGEIKFEFTHNSDISYIVKHIGECIS